MYLLENLKIKNQNVDILSIYSKSFDEYGEIIPSKLSNDELIEIEGIIDTPVNGSTYVANDESLSNYEGLRHIGEIVYGGLSFQIGYVTGYNDECNGFEFHQCSETMLFLSDAVIFLGKREQLYDNHFNINESKAFFVPNGVCIELYSTTLHYTPCSVSSLGFKAIVMLLKGTNSPIAKPHGILTKTNKWVITHPSKLNKIKDGVFPGIIGEIKKIRFD